MLVLVDPIPLSTHEVAASEMPPVGRGAVGKEGDATVGADALDDALELLEPHAASTGMRRSAALNAAALWSFMGDSLVARRIAD
jgi:hypothetical protein